MSHVSQGHWTAGHLVVSHGVLQFRREVTTGQYYLMFLRNKDEPMAPDTPRINISEEVGRWLSGLPGFVWESRGSEIWTCRQP
jgi:hypothetical protein